jgi:diadenosine tetraphosphate (Ap4A) HIT family hydrolase
MDDDCPLCRAISAQSMPLANEHAVAVTDAYPVSRGHTLIVSRRHVASLFDLSPDEQRGIWALLPLVKDSLDRELSPAGYNVGMNVGTAAGQTVGHVHVHVIPRNEGDAADPRGGVRWVLPDKAAYWKPNR